MIRVREHSADVPYPFVAQCTRCGVVAIDKTAEAASEKAVSFHKDTCVDSPNFVAQAVDAAWERNRI